MDVIRQRLMRRVEAIARDAAGVRDVRTHDACRQAIDSLLDRSRERLLRELNGPAINQRLEELTCSKS